MTPPRLVAAWAAGRWRLPANIHGLIGTAAPLAYVGAAAGIALIVACLAEVGSQFREGGGVYVYGVIEPLPRGVVLATTLGSLAYVNGSASGRAHSSARCSRSAWSHRCAPSRCLGLRSVACWSCR